MRAFLLLTAVLIATTFVAQAQAYQVYYNRGPYYPAPSAYPNYRPYYYGGSAVTYSYTHYYPNYNYYNYYRPYYYRPYYYSYPRCYCTTGTYCYC